MTRYQCCEAQTRPYTEGTLGYDHRWLVSTSCCHPGHCLDSQSRSHLLVRPGLSRCFHLRMKKKKYEVNILPPPPIPTPPPQLSSLIITLQGTSIKKDIFTLLCFQRFPPQCRKDPISPVISSYIQSAKHLRCCDGFGVHSHLSMRLTAVTHGFHQGVNTSSLTSTTWP